jgi:hypothetical protein
VPHSVWAFFPICEPEKHKDRFLQQLVAARIQFLKKILFLPIFLLAAACFIHTALAQQPGIEVYPSVQSRVLYQAEQLLAELQSTQYRHITEVNEKEGIFRMDCSGLVCYILSRAAPGALSAVPLDSGHSHARAWNFFNTIQQASAAQPHNGWQRIDRLIEARPGDFMVWRKKPVSKKGNTGHIVMVVQSPVAENDGLVRVVVLDSTRSGHAYDTRKKGQSGVGTGVMWFSVDRAGAPIALIWSDPKKPPQPYPIVIGRVAEVPASKQHGAANPTNKIMNGPKG